MIQLSVGQSFIADWLNIIEIIVIYKLLVDNVSLRTLLINIINSLLILLLSILTIFSSLNIVFIVFYLWLVDKIKSNQNIVIDSVFVMCIGIIMSSGFDLVDHYIGDPY